MFLNGGLAGPKGDTGPQGLTGSSGSSGAQGGRGDTGATGPTGSTGNQGGFGGFSQHWTFSNSVLAHSSNDGTLRLNSSGYNSATSLYVARANGDAVDLSAMLSTIAANDRVRIFSESDSSTFYLATVTSAVGKANYYEIGIVYGTNHGTFTNGASVVLTISPAGPKGDTGATGTGGTAGAVGATGAKGDTGNAGTAGAAGTPGATGAKGDTGTAGNAGSHGDTGANGPPYLFDNNAAGTHKLNLLENTTLTADRNFNIVTGDSDRTITLSGNPTLADWFDQSVKAASTPTWSGAHTWSASGITVNNSIPITLGTASDANQTTLKSDGTNTVFARTGAGTPRLTYDGGFIFANSVTEFCRIGPTPTLSSPTDAVDRFIVCKTSTQTSSGNQRAMVLTMEGGNTSSSSASFSGINAFVGTSAVNTAAVSTSTLGGGFRNRYVVSLLGTGVVAQASAVTAVVSSTGTSLGTILTNGTCYHAEGATPASGSTFTIAHGFWFHPTSLSGTVTNYVGLRLGMPTGTNNVQAALEGTGTGSGIYFNTNTTTPAVTTEFVNSNTSGNLDLWAGTSVVSHANLDLSAKNLITDTSTGTKIGTGSTQKLSFFGASTVAQQTITTTAQSDSQKITNIITALTNLGLAVTA